MVLPGGTPKQEKMSVQSLGDPGHGSPWPPGLSSVAPAGGPSRLLLPGSAQRSCPGATALSRQEAPGDPALHQPGTLLPTRTTVWGAIPPPGDL